MPEYIDVTPTWEQILHSLLLVYTDSETGKGKAYAVEELTRMAKLADKYVASQKEVAS